VLGADDPLYRAGISCLLHEAGVEVVGQVDRPEDLARKTRAHHPDVAVVDLDMGGELHIADRVKAVQEMRSIDPRMAMLVLSRNPRARHAVALMGDRPEGFGYLIKARIRDAEDLTASVRRVARGGTALDPVLLAQIAGRHDDDDPFDQLSQREGEVLALIARGRSNDHIAAELVITTGAVERHITSLFAKLELRTVGGYHRRVCAVLRFLER
jgi:DNA-binding NarL/FixJ family response regulator